MATKHSQSVKKKKKQKIRVWSKIQNLLFWLAFFIYKFKIVSKFCFKKIYSQIFIPN